MIYWVFKTRIHRWVLFTFVYTCILELVCTSIIIMSVIGFSTLLGLQIVDYLLICFIQYWYVTL